MNKLYSQIASLVVVVGLAGLWAFDKISEEMFGTISVAVIASIFAINQRYENNLLKTRNQFLEKFNSHLVTENKKKLKDK